MKHQQETAAGQNPKKPFQQRSPYQKTAQGNPPGQGQQHAVVHRPFSQVLPDDKVQGAEDTPQGKKLPAGNLAPAQQQKQQAAA